MSSISPSAVVRYMCVVLKIDYERVIEGEQCIKFKYQHGDSNNAERYAQEDFIRIWTGWKAGQPFSKSTSALRTLVIHLSCPSCEQISELPFTSTWADWLSATRCPAHLRRPLADDSADQVYKSSTVSQAVNNTDPRKATSLTNEELLQVLKERLEETKDKAFLGRFFGIAEELRWIKGMSECANCNTATNAGGGAGAAMHDLEGGGTGS